MVSMTDDRAPWLTTDQVDTWVRFLAVLELLPGALDGDLRRSSGLTHFEYQVLAMLSEADDRTLRMTWLAQRSNATLPRLSHVVTRLEARGHVERFPCAQDGRATNARLTDAGLAALAAAAPTHVRLVRELVVDALTPTQYRHLDEISTVLLAQLDPDGKMSRPVPA